MRFVKHLLAPTAKATDSIASDKSGTKDAIAARLLLLGALAGLLIAALSALPAQRTCTSEKFSTTCAFVTMHRLPAAAAAASGCVSRSTIASCAGALATSPLLPIDLRGRWARVAARECGEFQGRSGKTAALAAAAAAPTRGRARFERRAACTRTS